MNLLTNAEQRELRSIVRAFLDAHSQRRDGYSPGLYTRLNGELGLAGLIVPTEYGGAGAGHADLAVVLEETGAALLPGPFLATVFATIALTRLGDKELLTRAVEGGTAAYAAAPLTVTRATVSGDLPQLLSGMEAETLILRSGDALHAVALDGPGVSRTPLDTLDPTRGQARVTLDRAPARTLGAAPPDLDDLLAVALAAEQLGVMRAALDAIVGYAKIRAAFGRLIGSFQAVKHRLADMHCAVEQAESIVRYAAWAADESPAELPMAAALAQAYAGRACCQVTTDHLLLHGGIGFTWEHDAHLYVKRAKSDEVLLGPPRRYRARIAELLEL